ncbi:MAG TPA: RidA family protein [Actinomycetota bacterium]|nr:RidA family protein [Actinomycetota bacterium]
MTEEARPAALPTSPHRLVNPDTLPPPKGYSHAVVAAAGTIVALAGQTGYRADGTIVEDLVGQFDQAAWNVAEALRAAGGSPEHLVQLLMFVTDVAEYRARREEIGEAYRRHLGRHYPAMALLGVVELVDPRTKVELVGMAVVPTGS